MLNKLENWHEPKQYAYAEINQNWLSIKNLLTLVSYNFEKKLSFQFCTIFLNLKICRAVFSNHTKNPKTAWEPVKSGFKYNQMNWFKAEIFLEKSSSFLSMKNVFLIPEIQQCYNIICSSWDSDFHLPLICNKLRALLAFRIDINRLSRASI